MQTWSVFKRGKDKKKRYAKWTVSYTDENGRRRMRVGYVDREATVELGRRLHCQAARRREGIEDPFEEHRTAPITGIISEYVATLKVNGRSPRYVAQVENRLRMVMHGTKARTLGDLDPVAVGQFIGNLKNEATGEKLAGRTRNEYTVTIRSLMRWAVINRRLPHDPLVGVRQIEPKNIEPTRPKRALSDVELARLLDAAERRPMLELQMIRTGSRKGKREARVSRRAAARAARLGRERRIIYMMAAWTALRRGELRAIRWGDIRLDTIPPCIPLRKAKTKAKRADVLPIHSQLADELRKWKPPDASDTDLMFKAIPNMKVFRADLALAGILETDEQGYWVVFHALRVTSGTRMASHDVTQRAAQALMRHTDPRLTAGVYTDERLLPLAVELEKVPRIPTLDEINTKTILLPKTGTGGAKR